MGELVEFKTVANHQLFERMAFDCIVVGMSYFDFMTKLKNLDRSWAE